MAIPTLEDIVMLLIGCCIGILIGWKSRGVFYRKIRKLMRRM